MADNRVRVHHVNSCNLGKLGSDGVAMKINFTIKANDSRLARKQSAVFGLSHDLAHGLAKALSDILEQKATQAPAKSVQ